MDEVDEVDEEAMEAFISDRVKEGATVYTDMAHTSMMGCGQVALSLKLSFTHMGSMSEGRPTPMGSKPSCR